MCDPRIIERKAQTMFKTHLLHGWKLDWTRSKQNAGMCHYGPKVITLSRPIVEMSTVAEVEQTLYHEIAHALAGHKAGHGPYWLAIAKSIGYSGGQFHEGPAPSPTWLGTCPRGHQVVRHRLTKTSKLASCAICAPQWNPAHAYSWIKLPPTQAPPSARREAWGEACPPHEAPQQDPETGA